MTVRDMLAMPVGAQINVTNGYVKRKGRALFVLRATSYNTDRARWGTAKEIEADALYLAESGYLPKPIGGRW